ncbi:uncharacterized protein LOC121395462 [Xenopus laevis]|uniref:Uncharacterized protein LOC121395462 n=1 Tax=Xenopus laevis TaxID=8355 RepID=A0A8J1L8M3_XENLA|nr:uncharacterized protein LOC121395462 [Xenopus laevis]
MTAAGTGTGGQYDGYWHRPSLSLSVREKSVTDLLIEKEQEVEADNIDKEKSDVLPTKSDTDATKSEDKGAVGKNTIIFQNTTRVWKPKLRRPTFVNQNFTPSLKKGEIEHPTADTTKADYGPVNCTPRCKNAQLERPTADTTKADYGPVKRKRDMSNINMEERGCLPKKRKTGHINIDERGGMPKNMDERGGMPKDMEERGGMPKKRKISKLLAVINSQFILFRESKNIWNLDISILRKLMLCDPLLYTKLLESAALRLELPTCRAVILGLTM